MKDTYTPNKISVQLPTRGRPKYVIEIVNSLIENVSSTDNIEILLKLDDDDLDSINTIKNELGNHIDSLVKMVITPRLGGYFDLPTHHYSLSKEADGEWLFLFNDDLRLLTKDFDLLVKPHQGQIKFLHSNNVVDCEGWYFPFIHRDIIKTLGHLSIDTPYCDGWLRVLGEKLNIIEHIPVKLNHINVSVVDETSVERERVNNYARNKFDWDYHTNNENGLVYKDIEILKKIL